MTFLTKEQILLMHGQLIVRYGGTHGVRDLLHNRSLRMSASTEMWRRFFRVYLAFQPSPALQVSLPLHVHRGPFWLVLEPFWRRLWSGGWLVGIRVSSPPRTSFLHLPIAHRGLFWAVLKMIW